MKPSLFFLLPTIMVLLAAVLLTSQSKTCLANSDNVTASPSFSLNEIADEPFDWIDFWRGKQNGEGPSYIDIQSVNYFSNGRFLNATIWYPMSSQLNSSSAIPPNNSEVSYGMYIDADFNNKTGVEGIDYKVEIQWDNRTSEWNRVVEEWGTNTNARVLNFERNYSGVSEGYASLFVDMDTLTSPAKYKVIFYAQEINGKSWIIDHTEWVYIPPPSFAISTLPTSLDLKAGENTAVEVSVKSVEGFEPAVFLYVSDQPTGAKFDFKYNRLKIPSYGIATTPLFISTNSTALQGPHTVSLFANFTFPNEKFITPFLQAKSQSIGERTSIVLRINSPPAITDLISDFWQKLGSPINFLYVVLAALSPFIYRFVKKRLERNRSTV